MDDTGEGQLAGKANTDQSMMRLSYFFIAAFIFSMAVYSCGYRYDRSAKYEDAYSKFAVQKSDTLIVSHAECTECSDLYILEGKLSIPPGIKLLLRDSMRKDLKVCGKFPLDFLDITALNSDSEAKYKIVGKVIMADTLNPAGAIPVFYTEHWTKLK